MENDYRVTIADNFDPYYSKDIKLKNISIAITSPYLTLVDLDILDTKAIYSKLTRNYEVIVHLAAKAGVRPSIEDPITYQDVNVKGTQNMLEFARHKNIKQFVFASSSSVYGTNINFPWKESDVSLKPISPYASTKISGELWAMFTVIYLEYVLLPCVFLLFLDPGNDQICHSSFYKKNTKQRTY